MTPTARSLALLRTQGWTACVVEKWIPQARKRLDAFGFGDILACRENETPVLVQVTTGANVAARRDKIKTTPEARIWWLGGGRIRLDGWSKQGRRGERKIWKCRSEWVIP